MSINIQPKSFIQNAFDTTLTPATGLTPSRNPIVDGAIDGVNGAVVIAENPVKAEKGGFWSRLVDGAKNIGSLFSLNTLKDLGGGIKGFFGKAMDSMLWAGGKLGDGFMKFMEGGAWVAGKMREGVIAGAKAVGGFFKKVGEGFGEFFKHPLDSLKSFGGALKGVASKAWNGLLGLGGKMGDGFMKFMESGAWAAGKMREGVVKAADAIGSAAKKVGSFIKGLF